MLDDFLDDFRDGVAPLCDELVKGDTKYGGGRGARGGGGAGGGGGA